VCACFRRQLHKAKTDGDTFVGLREGPVMFRPTYKLEIGSYNYSSSNKKVRVPAWTDRILYRCNRPSARRLKSKTPGAENNGIGFEHPPEFDEEMTLLTYKSIEELQQSDHRPVVAVFAGPALAPGRRKVSYPLLLCEQRTASLSFFCMLQNKQDKKPDSGSKIGEVASQVCTIS